MSKYKWYNRWWVRYKKSKTVFEQQILEQFPARQQITDTAIIEAADNEVTFSIVTGRGRTIHISRIYIPRDQINHVFPYEYINPLEFLPGETLMINNFTYNRYFLHGPCYINRIEVYRLDLEHIQVTIQGFRTE